MTGRSRRDARWRLAIVAPWLVAALLVTIGSEGGAAERVRRLADGWQHWQGSLGSTWEVWRGDAASDNVTWTPVTLPHCFNARDAVDPDVRYYQGPGWYRTGLALGEPAYLELWRRLPADPTDAEVQRNIAVTQPLLWLTARP